MSFIAEGTLEPDLALQMARVIGSSLDRVATAQVDAMQIRREAVERGRAARRSRCTPRRQRRAVVADAEADRVRVAPPTRGRGAPSHHAGLASEDGTAAVLVGFADLVGFTAKTQQLEEAELAEVVGRFEAIAYDVVADHGGRVVKMIGDEVMFLHDQPREGAALALDLAERFRDDDDLSDVRVGLACGSVLERDADVYGNVVNLANRIVSVAYPGTVVISEELAEALRDDERVRHCAPCVRTTCATSVGCRCSPCAAPPIDATRRTRVHAVVASRREFLRERWIDLRAGCREALGRPARADR